MFVYTIVDRMSLYVWQAIYICINKCFSLIRIKKVVYCIPCVKFFNCLYLLNLFKTKFFPQAKHALAGFGYIQFWNFRVINFKCFDYLFYLSTFSVFIVTDKEWISEMCTYSTSKLNIFLLNINTSIFFGFLTYQSFWCDVNHMPYVKRYLQRKKKQIYVPASHISHSLFKTSSRIAQTLLL